MSETMNYEALSRDVCGAALTELIPADLRARGVRVEYHDCIELGNYGTDCEVWLIGGLVSVFGEGRTFPDAMKRACEKIEAKLGYLQ